MKKQLFAACLVCLALLSVAAIYQNAYTTGTTATVDAHVAGLYYGTLAANVVTNNGGVHSQRLNGPMEFDNSVAVTNQAGNTLTIYGDLGGDWILSLVRATGGGRVLAGGVDNNGTFTGNGGGLTNLNASNISSGTVPLAQLGLVVKTNAGTAWNLTVFGTLTADSISTTTWNVGTMNVTNPPILNLASSTNYGGTIPVGNVVGLGTMALTNASDYKAYLGTIYLTVGGNAVSATTAGNLTTISTNNINTNNASQLTSGIIDPSLVTNGPGFWLASPGGTVASPVGGAISVNINSTAAYMSVFGGISYSATESSRSMKFGHDRTCTSLYVKYATIGAGTNYTATVMTNGVASNASVSLTGAGAAVDGTWTGSVPIAAGATVSLKFLGNNSVSTATTTFWDLEL